MTFYCNSRSCKRSDTLFQKSLLLFLAWREYFYSQPKKYWFKQSFPPFIRPWFSLFARSPLNPGPHSLSNITSQQKGNKFSNRNVLPFQHLWSLFCYLQKTNSGTHEKLWPTPQRWFNPKNSLKIEAFGEELSGEFLLAPGFRKWDHQSCGKGG